MTLRSLQLATALARFEYMLLVASCGHRDRLRQSHVDPILYLLIEISELGLSSLARFIQLQLLLLVELPSSASYIVVEWISIAFVRVLDKVLYCSCSGSVQLTFQHGRDCSSPEAVSPIIISIHLTSRQVGGSLIVFRVHTSQIMWLVRQVLGTLEACELKLLCLRHLNGSARA